MRRQENPESVVTAAREGDREAMGLLIKQHLAWVRAIVSGSVDGPENVDDVCQDVFVSAWEKIGELRDVKGFSSWLYRIAVNKARSFLRESRRKSTNPLIGDAVSWDPPGGEQSVDRVDLLRQALKKLEPKYRDPLIVHYLQGKSCLETARVLGLKDATTRIRLLRGRRKLEEILRREGIV